MKNETLAQARKDKGWTQEEFANLMGCKKTTVSNWENGYSNPILEDAFKAADLLDRDVNFLFRLTKVQETQTSTA